MEPITLGLFVVNLVGTCLGTGTTIAGAVNESKAAAESHKDQVEGAENTVKINSENSILGQVNWAKGR